MIVPYIHGSEYLVKNSFYYWYGKPINAVAKGFQAIQSLIGLSLSDKQKAGIWGGLACGWFTLAIASLND